MVYDMILTISPPSMATGSTLISLKSGRVCYKSEAKITDTSAAAFVAGIIKAEKLVKLADWLELSAK